MSAAPPVSVLLPVRNGGDLLRTALDSLRLQTFADFEVVLQDDGSTDDSWGTARSFAQRDGRFRIERGEAEGIVAALNAAAARARGDLLVRMDADDVSEAIRLQRLVDVAATRPDVAFFGSRVVPLAVGGELSEGMRAYHAWLDGVCEHDAIVAQRFVECPLPHPTWALRAGLFRALRGYRNGPFPEDYDFFFRAVDLGVRFHKVSERLLLWRDHAGRASRNDERYSLAAFFGLKARFLVPWIQDRKQDVVIAGTGKAARRWARRLTGAGRNVRAFLDRRLSRAGERLEGRDVLSFDSMERATGAVVLVAVGRSVRALYVRALAAFGLEQGRDVLCVQ